MFITRGTVKVHLAHIFAKLGVATRSELAAEATRRDRPLADVEDLSASAHRTAAGVDSDGPG
jgi:hypothetical protein